MLSNGSVAFTVTSCESPGADGFASPLTSRCVAALAFTLIEADVPVMDAVIVSVAVTVCVPAVFSVSLNVSVPFVSVEFAGSTACPSLEVKCTVPL